MSSQSVPSASQSLVNALATRLPGVLVTSYTGATAGPSDSSTVVSIKSPTAFAQLLRAPRGLGVARAWVTGTIDIAGDLHDVVQHEDGLRDFKLYAAVMAATLRATPSFRLDQAFASGPTPIEYRRPFPGRHSIPRDLTETDFHYGRTLDFYRYLLGHSLTYSSAIFCSPEQTLESAQSNKHETICQKLQVHKDSVLLDVGCGWGSLLRYAIQHYSCAGIGITASKAQFQALSTDSGLTCAGLDVAYGDYRQCLPLAGATAAASVGLYEHIGARNSPRFFSLIRSSLASGSRYLNQAIVRREQGPKRFRSNSFAQRYIFPNAQLLPLSHQLRDLELAGFQVLGVSLHGDSYARTLRCWIDNLTTNWDACVGLEGEQRVRAWYMYLVGALTRFERRSIDVAQVLCQAR